MNKLYRWLADRPLTNLLLVLVYYVMVVLPHEVVGLTIFSVFKDKSRAFYNNAMLLTAVVVGLLIFIPFVKQIIRHPNKPKLLGYMALTLGLIILSFNTIIILSVELIHILQYAVFAVLAFPLFKHYWLTLLMVTLAGSLDEAYQYFYLSPERTNYYDLNDVIIDTLGGAVGLVWLYGHQINQRPRSLQSVVLSFPVMGNLILVLGVALLIAMGVMAYYPTEGVAPLWTLVRKIPDSFWTTLPVGPTTFHISLPLEGMAYVLILWVTYWWLYFED